MSFKQTVRNQRVSHFVASSALGLAEKVSGKVAEKLSPKLREGEVLPDLKLLQKLVARYLEDSGLQVLEVDDRYSNEQLVGRDLRIERKQMLAQLRLRLRDVRFLFDRQFGPEKTAAYLPKRAFSRLPAADLIRLANQAAMVLRDPERGWQQLAVGGFEGSSASLADQLEAETRQLQEVLDRQEGPQARLTQLGLEEKSAELAASSQAIRGGASLLAGLYTFADLPFHAQRVRRRASRRTTQPESEAPPASPSPGAPPPAGSGKEVPTPITI